MTDKKVVQKRKRSKTGIFLASLMLSFLILYGIAVYLWVRFGYEKALSFFTHLLNANQTTLVSLKDTLLSAPLAIQLTQKMCVSFQEAHWMEKAHLLTQSGTHTLKEGLSGFFNDDFMSEAGLVGSSFLTEAYNIVLKASLLFTLALKICSIKAFMLIAAIPLFLLLGLVGLIDGLSLREIRRAELGRESSYLFHMLNKWIAKLICLGLCAWVCLPMAMSPQWFFVPLGLLFSLMLSLSASKFKKYL